MSTGDWVFTVFLCLALVGIVAFVVWANAEGNTSDARTAVCVRNGYAVARKWLDTHVCVGYTDDGTLRIIPLAELEAK